jgi:hypothetical protein
VGTLAGHQNNSSFNFSSHHPCKSQPHDEIPTKFIFSCDMLVPPTAPFTIEHFVSKKTEKIKTVTLLTRGRTLPAFT